jgi:hypothetical protein
MAMRLEWAVTGLSHRAPQRLGNDEVAGWPQHCLSGELQRRHPGHR